jgi:hypothetical protein
MDDEHFLALGRAVYAFQCVEWMTIWTLTLLDDSLVTKYDGKPFGALVKEMDRVLRESRWQAEQTGRRSKSWPEISPP